MLRTDKTKYMFWVGRDGEDPNFGDLVGPYLYKKITGLDPEFCHPTNRQLKTVLFSVGSILYWSQDNAIVWGSGIARKNESFPKPHRVYSVRGPETRKRFLELNYPCPDVYGDPALLLSKYYHPRSDLKKYKLGVIPHFVDKEVCNMVFQNVQDLLIINVFDHIESIVDQIYSCQRIASSSLHGIITAHAYGVPAIWIKFGDRLWGDNVKFQDYYKSINEDWSVEYVFVDSKDSLENIERIFSNSLQPETIRINEIQNEIFNVCPFRAPRMDPKTLAFK